MEESTKYTEIADQFKDWWEHPEIVMKGAFGEDLWDKQIELLHAIRDHKYVCCRSANSMGKTHGMGVAAFLYSIAHYPSYVVLTSASHENLRKTLLPQVRYRIVQARQKMGMEKIWAAPDVTEWWPYGKKGKAHAIVSDSPRDKENIMGRHNDSVLVIVDEASSPTFTPELMTAIYGITTRPNDKIVLIGNPLSGSGPMFDAFHNNTWSIDNPNGWYPVHINALDSPNVKARKIVVPGLASHEWVEKMKLEFGEDSPEYMARVKGEFPEMSTATIISRKMVQDAINLPDAPSEGGGVMGIDIATSEVGDETVYVIVEENQLVHLESYRGIKEPAIAEYAKRLAKEYAVKKIKIDATGNPSVYHLLEADGMEGIHKVVSSQRAHDAVNYANTRAEMYWALKKGFEAGLSIPGKFARKFLSEAGIERDLNSARLKVEDKEKIRKRIGKSPDFMDALALCYAKDVGELAFQNISEIHKMKLKPEIFFDTNTGRWTLHQEGMPSRYNRPGDLVRGMWVSKSDPSACVWAHVDDDRCWTVFDALCIPGGLKDFLHYVGKKSEGHQYLTDAVGSKEDEKIANLIAEYILEMPEDQQSYPTHVPHSKISGKQGLDSIDNLLTGTEKMMSKDAEDEPMLLVWPDQVLEALANARIESPGAGYIEGAEKSEKNIESSLVKALKAVAVESVFMPIIQ